MTPLLFVTKQKPRHPPRIFLNMPTRMSLFGRPTTRFLPSTTADTPPKDGQKARFILLD